ncbi:prolyl oligopeptidase family serine peptidase [Tundrisphaera lichenicola]|uniref:S9 family peptidase n=1 Tax=Tundrisphaera lichenicola TaxID=2029860 RepID=UPI003EB6E35C
MKSENALKNAKSLLVFLALFLRCWNGSSEAQITSADYDRANRLASRMQGRVFRDHIDPHWFGEDSRFWYRLELAGGAIEFIEVDARSGTRKPAFAHDRIADAITKVAGHPIDSNHLPIDFIQIEDNGKIRFNFEGAGLSYDPVSDRLAESEPLTQPKVSPEASRRRREYRPRQATPRNEQSPDGKWKTSVRDFNLYLEAVASGEIIALGTDGSEESPYESRVFWSPDSKKLVALKTTRGDDREVNLIESSPRSQLQPRLSSFQYLKPGDKIPVTKPRLFDVERLEQVRFSDEHFDNPWSIEEIRWKPDSSRFTFIYNQRGHQVLRVLCIDAVTGEVRILVDERSRTFIDYSNKTFLQFIDDTNELIWMSERDGWNHLYLIDASSGTIKKQITQGEWVVRGIDRIDLNKRQIWFRAMGIFPGQDPYNLHHARVDFDGSHLVRLTDGDGSHRIQYSPDRKSIIDTYSRVDLAPVTELRKVEDGSLICELERGDDSALKSEGWASPERFVAKGRDGQTDIHGVIFRPTNLDPSKHYPVIEMIYAGPQGAFVPKEFSAYFRTQSLAEIGFVVVQIDGMGTNWRSKAFHDVCSRNLADAGFPDRILWMKSAAAKYPYLDLSRVGVYGGSAGGQNALGALLFHGDFYKAAASDCGCHDNRMDKIWWNEAWMGWPIGPHYAEQSNVTNAHRLRGALLLTVGELDHNVDPASTLQVVAALIRANKDFELVVFPGADHGAGGGAYGERRRRDFFVKNLLHLDPPNRNITSSEGDD